jgi:hypothetical protein
LRRRQLSIREAFCKLARQLLARIGAAAHQYLIDCNRLKTCYVAQVASS